MAATLRRCGAAQLTLRTDSDWIADIVRFALARKRSLVRRRPMTFSSPWWLLLLLLVAALAVAYVLLLRSAAATRCCSPTSRCSNASPRSGPAGTGTCPRPR